MKLTVMGGAGVRTPLLLAALTRRQQAIDLEEVCLLDLDRRKLELMGPLCRYALEQTGGRYRLSWTSDSRQALSGSGAVITTIRVGGEEGRARDERIALDHGVLGQETTGAVGFSMALRSIPAVAGYARQMLEICPDAWLLNFTNPAGLVTQAISEEFPELKVVGICDTPTSLWRAIAALYGRTASEIEVTVFGLNHLSWMPAACLDGTNLVPSLIADPGLQARIHQLALFEPGLLRLIGMLPNEYLYYYYYRDRALTNLLQAGESRGSQVHRLSTQLLDDLEAIDPAAHPEEARRRHARYLHDRHGTYMAAETGRAGREPETPPETSSPGTDEGEGYAGVALDIVAAAISGHRTQVVANVPNAGAIAGLAADDVVEISCECDRAGIRPLPVEQTPPDSLLLMQQIKRYERLTVAANRARSRDLAVEALLNHPLVGSYPLACSLVDALLSAHRPTLGEWM
ncbi:MAG TPA: glycoside hydrolase [Chloroflexota bacterium]|nr:glycoside hydrolase [Chloroflexota bacterium]